MTDSRTLVVVGGGLAGAKAVEGARAAGFEGRIVLAADEPHLPYERPPLSKAVLRGEAEPSTAEVAGKEFIDEHSVEILTDTPVVGIDVGARAMRLGGQDGGSIPFDQLVLATGAVPRRITVSGSDLGGIHYLRTVNDSLELKAAISSGGRVGVIGAGWIGTEVAASARQMGADVVMIDPSEVPLQRVLGSEIGGAFRRLHADQGVDLRLGVGVDHFRGSGSVKKIVLSDGNIEEVDMVVVGIGVEPVTDLAAEAGLAVDNGIVVDRHLATDAPGIYAAGDVANAFHPHYGTHIRVEHWANALNQGKTAGANAAGAGDIYDRLPYFFSDQYDLGMEYVGFGRGDDEVVTRGSVEDREFIAWWLRDGKVTAAMNVNVWDVVDDFRAIISSGKTFDRDRLANPDLALKEL